MKNILARLFAHDPKGTEPRIIELAEPILIAGMSMDTDIRRIYRDVPRLARRYEEYKETNEISNTKEPWAFAAVSKDYDEETGRFTYILGDVVTEFQDVPPDLSRFEIPAMKYAVFPVRPKNRFGWGFAIASMKRYAYENWLPSSEYSSCQTIDDFEYHDARSTRRKSPEIDLYVCIREKHPATGKQANHSLPR